MRHNLVQGKGDVVLVTMWFTVHYQGTRKLLLGTYIILKLMFTKVRTKLEME